MNFEYKILRQFDLFLSICVFFLFAGLMTPLWDIISLIDSIKNINDYSVTMSKIIFVLNLVFFKKNIFFPIFVFTAS